MSFVCVGLCEIILAILKSEIDVIYLRKSFEMTLKSFVSNF